MIGSPFQEPDPTYIRDSAFIIISVIVIIAIFILAPLGIIWALNTLFALDIPMNISSWTAVMILAGVFIILVSSFNE